MRICNIPRVMSSPFSTMAGKQPAASKENRTLWNTNNTRTGRYHKIEHTHGWILNLSSRGSTLWSYFRQRPPLIQLVPWCSWVFARVLYLLLPLLLLLSLAERIGAVLRRCGDSSLRHRPSLTRARATERRYTPFAKRRGRKHRITSESILDFTLIVHAMISGGCKITLQLFPLFHCSLNATWQK